MTNLRLSVPTPGVPSCRSSGSNIDEGALQAYGASPQETCEDPDDADLIHAVQNGCDRSFDLLFARYWRLVFAIASKILRQRTDAEDIVQDVFLTIYLRSDRYDASRGSVRTWIAQFAHFKALVRRRSIQLSDADNFDAVIEFEAGLLRFGAAEGVLERAALVQECLATLNPRQRRTVELVHFDGYTLLETATILKQSLANTRNLYYRGLSALRGQLLAAQCEPAANAPAVVSVLSKTAAESFILERTCRP